MEQDKLQLSGQTGLGSNLALTSSLGGLGLVTQYVWGLTFLICKLEIRTRDYPSQRCCEDCVLYTENPGVEPPPVSVKC